MCRRNTVSKRKRKCLVLGRKYDTMDSSSSFVSSIMTSLCTLCGNERVLSKTWKEVVKSYNNLTTITHTQFVCTNTKCQKLVEAQLAQQRARKEIIEHQKELAKANKDKNANKLPSTGNL